MQGGRRRRRRVSRRKGRKGQKKGRKSQKQQKQQQGGRKRRVRRQGGGSHDYALVNTPGLLLGSAEEYTRAGLNAEYFQSNSTEQLVADKRDSV